MQDLPFITENPAIKEFDRGNEAAQKQQLSNLQQQQLKVATEKGAFDLQTARTEAPTRLRQLTAQADLTGTQAQTAQAAAPYAAPMAAAGLEEKRAHIASLSAATAQAQWANMKQTLDLIDTGRPDDARALAARNGEQIPETIFNNANMRQNLRQIEAVADKTYPNHPQLRMMFMTTQVHHADELAKQGQQVNPQTFAYEPTPGLPTPPESNAAAPPGYRPTAEGNLQAIPGGPHDPAAIEPFNVPAGGTTIDKHTGQPIFQSTQPKWGIVGTDSYGNPQRGWINPQNQTITSPAPPPPAAAPAPAAAPVAAAPPVHGDMPMMAPGPAPQPGQVHGEDYLRTLPAEERGLVQGIAENRINPNSLSIKGGHRERILGQVEQYKPGFNQTLFTGDQSYQRTAGGAGARIEFTSNEVVQALPLAVEASRNLPRGQYVPWNTLVQRFHQGTSDPAYNDFVLKNFALINAYTRAMNPLGLPRIQERLEQQAQGILSTATSSQAYEVQARALWQEVQRSRAAVAETRAGTGPSVNDASTDRPMPGMPPPPGAPPDSRQAPDGNWYVPDPNRPGKYLQVVH